MDRVLPLSHVALATFVAAISCCSSSVHALERGVWFWYQSSDPNGAANVVGNTAAENDAIAFFHQWDVTRVYGSYSSLTTTNPTAVGAWNKKLAQAGIDSYVVLSDPTLVLPTEQAHLQSLVNTRLVNFNNGRVDPEQRFVGVEMDLEPHTLPEWSTGTNASRRDLLLNLRDAYTTVRSTVSAGGFGSAALSAALPVWFDTSSTIGWTNTAQRDQWFADISTPLDSISLMAYETSSTSTILSSTSFERANFAGDVELALRCLQGIEWTSYSQFANATSTLETQLGQGIDIENYYRLRQVVPTSILAGDFNNDATVDAADYIAWRRGGPLQNDPTPGISNADYETWSSQFGNSSGSGAMAGNLNVTPVPEAGIASLALVASMLGLFARAKPAWVKERAGLSRTHLEFPSYLRP